MKWPFELTFKGQKFYIFDSLIDFRSSHIYKGLERTDEIFDENEKYVILQVARHEAFNRLVYHDEDKRNKVFSSPNIMIVGSFKVRHTVRFLDRRFAFISNNQNENDVFFCLEIGNRRFAIINEENDKDGFVLGVINEKMYNSKKDNEFSLPEIIQFCDILNSIDSEYSSSYKLYTKEKIMKILNKKSLSR